MALVTVTSALASSQPARADVTSSAEDAVAVEAPAFKLTEPVQSVDEPQTAAEPQIAEPQAAAEPQTVDEPQIAEPQRLAAASPLPNVSSQEVSQDKIRTLLGEAPSEAIAPPERSPAELLRMDTASIEVAQAPATPSTPAQPLPSIDELPPTTETAPADPRVLVAEVAVSGATGELEDIVYNAVQTTPGQTTSRSQLQADVNAIFATGYFSRAEAVPQDTPLGVRITFQVVPNPVLQSVEIPDAQVLPQEVINEAFGEQYGEVINLNEIQDGIDTLLRWYQENGYVLAQVVDAPRVGTDGTVTLAVAEGVIEDIQVQFLNEDGEAFDEDGEPVEGKTRDFIITREFETQPGDVFNQQQIERDLASAFALGIFEDLRIALNPGDNPQQVDVIVNAIEGQTGSIAAGIGVSSASGLFGTVSYQERNLGGNNQRLSAEVQAGERDLLFDLSFTDPWIAGDPNRTSYTVNAFSRRSIPLVFQGGEDEVFLENGDRPRVRRLGGGVRFGRPLENNWQASLGLQYQNIRLQDSDGDLAPEDEFGNDLSFSGDGTDDLFLLQFSVSQDLRNNPVTPTSGSVLRLSSDQSIPIGQGNIFLNRLRASYSYFIPVNITNFSEGPETLAFNVQGGVVLGDLPPYEAFSLGGTDSVRGYDPGDVGSGRAFALATVEYRFPIISIFGGALFADFGTDLGTGDEVPGEPAEIRGKPGSGFGYGIGIRVQSPLGAIRIDYAINDEGDNQIHFGIGERF
nr:BamA/TamA family outer membrane protein [Leptolyngbya sp. FACHB-16]